MPFLKIKKLKERKFKSKKSNITELSLQRNFSWGLFFEETFMSISIKIKQLLDRENVPYEILQHSLAYTASEIAKEQHVPGKKLIKSVIVCADDSFIMCVLSSVQNIDFGKLKKILKTENIRLATEEEMKMLMPEEELGAEAPFGMIYGIKILVDRIVEENDEIIFNAGTHTHLVQMKYRDFAALALPEIANFGRHR